MATIMAPAFATATSGVDPSDAGVASALVNTMQQVGGSVGTALLSSAASVHGYTVAFRARPAGGYWSRCSRSPCGPTIMMSSTGPSTAPNQCGVQVENSTVSPASIVKSASPRSSRSGPLRT